jgi:hypothetical protein
MPLDLKRIQELVLGPASDHDTGDRAPILDRECLADRELQLRVQALPEAHGHITHSRKQPRAGSEDPDKPWLA